MFMQPVQYLVREKTDTLLHYKRRQDGDTEVYRSWDSSSERHTHTHTGECEDRWICSGSQQIFLFRSGLEMDRFIHLFWMLPLSFCDCIDPKIIFYQYYLNWFSNLIMNNRNTRLICVFSPGQAQRWRLCHLLASPSSCSAAWRSLWGVELWSWAPAPSTLMWRNCKNITTTYVWMQWVTGATWKHQLLWIPFDFHHLWLFFGFQITEDDEIGVKFLDKSLIEDVQVRLFCLFPCRCGHIFQIVQSTEKRLHQQQCFRKLLSPSMHVKSTHTPALETVNVWEHPSNQSASVSQDGQKCCFLRLVLHFYVERVFRSYTSSQPQYGHSLSSLANTFIIIRKQMHKCVSHLRSETGAEKTKRKHV